MVGWRWMSAAQGTAGLSALERESERGRMREKQAKQHASWSLRPLINSLSSAPGPPPWACVITAPWLCSTQDVLRRNRWLTVRLRDKHQPVQLNNTNMQVFTIHYTVGSDRTRTTGSDPRGLSPSPTNHVLNYCLKAHIDKEQNDDVVSLWFGTQLTGG